MAALPVAGLLAIHSHLRIKNANAMTRLFNFFNQLIKASLPFSQKLFCFSQMEVSGILIILRDQLRITDYSPKKQKELSKELIIIIDHWSVYSSVTRPSALPSGRAVEIKNAPTFNGLMQSTYCLTSLKVKSMKIMISSASWLIQFQHMCYIFKCFFFSCSFFLSKNERRALRPPSQGWNATLEKV